jgi:hypothetical protein
MRLCQIYEEHTNVYINQDSVNASDTVACKIGFTSNKDFQGAIPKLVKCSHYWAFGRFCPPIILVKIQFLLLYFIYLSGTVQAHCLCLLLYLPKSICVIKYDFG